MSDVAWWAPYATGALLLIVAQWAAERLVSWVRWRWSWRCICNGDRVGYVRVGNADGWEWDPCPFCRRGHEIHERKLAARSPGKDGSDP